MIRLFCRSFALFLLVPVLVDAAQDPGSDSWRRTDMTTATKDDELEATITPPESGRESSIIIMRGERLKVRLNSTMEQPPNVSCSSKECFDLYYFKGEPFDTTNGKRKNILYIPGGPGDIVSRDATGRDGSGLAVNLLEADHNVIYFDPRGAGLSRIEGSNTFDQFLRAKYIVGDIEQIRKKELGKDSNGKDVKWDAIFGYSYGTVIAQQYAKAHPTMVGRLILAAPIDRRKDSEQARTDRVLDNLENIYKLIQSKDSEPCDCTQRVLIASPIPVPQGLAKRIFPTHNFCFLRDAARMKKIRVRLNTVYNRLEEEYGSVGFVTQNYSELKGDPDFTKAFPYPQAFFIALRQLQLLGAPQEQDSLLFEEQINDLVNAAMVAGYYAMFDQDTLTNLQNAHFPGCEISVPFFKGVEGTPACASGYCKNRIDAAENQLVNRLHTTESARDLYVLGVYDGINRWIFRTLKEKVKDNGKCKKGLKGEDIEEFAKGTGDSYKFLREQAGRIGIVPNEDICPWDPGQYRHEVQTLLLVGGADAVTAGCQPEDFFNDGLVEGKRVLIEFPSMGHQQYIRLKDPKDFGPQGEKTSWGKAYQSLLVNFLTLSAKEFRENEEVISKLNILKARDRTPQSGTPMKCLN